MKILTLLQLKKDYTQIEELSISNEPFERDLAMKLLILLTDYLSPETVLTIPLSVTNLCRYWPPLESFLTIALLSNRR
jgi:hypothetical protein